MKPSADAAHVSYTLPRTEIVRTAKGNYAKVVVYRVYKGAPEVPSRASKPGYIALKYFIQKDVTKSCSKLSDLPRRPWLSGIFYGCPDDPCSILR